MGQKVNPIGFRTGVMIGWKSRWYASKREFAELLVEDQKIRKFVKKRQTDVPHDCQDRDRAYSG
jgi:small subunit ribosomal protein S3